ncbi:hypothetical protein [Dapis sp. BLCC M229]|uniref:hypothetical protein n=1 Tax=Dapis sp. BLCC M229 TaxID=3400188 RepID=UPI003CF79774
MSDFKLVYQYKDTTLVQPEVRFGIYPPSKTEKKIDIELKPYRSHLVSLPA